MKQKWFSRYLIVFTSLLLSVYCTAAPGSDGKVPEGGPPAKFSLPAPDSAQEQQYLGLKTMEPFTVPDIGAKLVFIDFVSAMCPKCQANAPTVNRLYKLIHDDPSLSKDVKIIGVAVGNNKKEADAFKKGFKIPFPLFPDEGMAISASMEGVETPTLMLVQAQSGKVLGGHEGIISDFDAVVKDMREILKKQ
jgi:thiol-disulfide isomerase/thioredoxin